MSVVSGVTGRRVLVTGGAGFLGQRVCDELRDAGVAELIAPRRHSFDLVRPGDVERMLDEIEPATVIHLAAEVGGIGANQAQPGRFFYANLAMGMNLIEACRTRQVEKFVQVGTVCAYPKYLPLPFSEDDLWSGYPEETNAPYGIAKKALLVMLQAYREQYGMNGVYLLPVNLYGPRDNFDPSSSHVIPALIRKLEDAREANAPSVSCWGTGEASREFLYVEDCARGIVRAAEMYSEPEPINLGSGDEITILELAELLAELIGYGGQLHWDTSRPDGQPRRCVSTARARERLNFEAATELRDGLERTIAWYREYRSALTA